MRLTPCSLFTTGRPTTTMKRCTFSTACLSSRRPQLACTLTAASASRLIRATRASGTATRTFSRWTLRPRIVAKRRTTTKTAALTVVWRPIQTRFTRMTLPRIGRLRIPMEALCAHRRQNPDQLWLRRWASTVTSLPVLCSRMLSLWLPRKLKSLKLEASCSPTMTVFPRLALR